MSSFRRTAQRLDSDARSPAVGDEPADVHVREPSAPPYAPGAAVGLPKFGGGKGDPVRRLVEAEPFRASGHVVAIEPRIAEGHDGVATAKSIGAS